MQIKINTENLKLNPTQEKGIRRKVEHLTHLASRLTDESSYIKIDLSREDVRRKEDAFKCSMTFFVPHDTLLAKARRETLANAVDEVVDKLRAQIERYKAKIHHLEERKNQ